MTFDEALHEYRMRQAGQVSVVRAVGQNDKGFTTYEPISRQPCCEDVNEMNIADHAHTAKHLAHEVGLDPDAFTDYVRVHQIRRTMKTRRR